MTERLPDELLPKTTPAQEEFITKYIDKSYKKKKAAQQAMLQSAWLTYQSSRSTCANVVDLVMSVARTEEDYTFVREMKSECATAIAKIKPGLFKGLSDATSQIVAVAELLVQLKNKALAYMRDQASSGRDLDTEARIKVIKSTKRAELLEINSEFGAEAETLRAKVRREAPNVSWDPEEVGKFARVFSDSSNAIFGIPQTGETANVEQAEETAGTAVETARTAKTELLGTMADFADGEEFAMFVADMRRRDEVVVALKEARSTLDQLERWGAPEATRVASEADAIEGDIPEVFKDRAGLSESEAREAETAQETLLGRAVALKRTAEAAITSTREAFDSELDELRPQVERLEARWEACKSNVGTKQSAPIIAQMTAMRLSLDGLGGCNPAAVDAVRKMIKASTDLIAQAEHIEELNQRIKDTLSEADTLAKGLTGKDNPIADVFTTHRTEIATLKDEYKSKSINDATKGADAKLAAVQKDAERNQQLIDARRAIQERIGRRETQLSEFNELFRQMQKRAHPDREETDIKDYRGSFQADLETCKNWAATKTDPAFYATINAKLDSLLTELAKEMGNLRLLLSKDPTELALEGTAAAEKHRDANLDLNRQDGEALARLAEAQQLLAKLLKQKEDGEEVDPSELEAAQEAIDAAEGDRSEIREKRAAVQKEYDEATHLLDRQYQLEQELARAEAADALAARKREEFIVEAKAWLTEIKAEVKNSESVLHDYKDEANPQIERVETSRDMLKKNKPGVTGESAYSELRFVKNFLDGLRKRGKRGSKKTLGDIGVQWDREVVKINTAATNLVTAIEKFEEFPEVEGTASADVEKMFGVIMGRMMDHQFEHAARTFDGSEDRQERKAAREEALNEVRRLRALMFNDPLMQKCVMNPFGVPVGSSAANRLDEIELNVLRGI